MSPVTISPVYRHIKIRDKQYVLDASRQHTEGIVTAFVPGSKITELVPFAEIKIPNKTWDDIKQRHYITKNLRALEQLMAYQVKLKSLSIVPLLTIEKAATLPWFTEEDAREANVTGNPKAKGRRTASR